MKQSVVLRLRERCQILGDIVVAISPLYRSSTTTASQKDLMETLIGAAIWYFPKLPENWTEKISVNAIKMYLPDSGISKPTLSEEHEFPRKKAGEELLSREWESISNPGNLIYSLYLEKYGKYNFVTKEENKKLSSLQKKGVFISPKVAYQQAGIILVDVTREDLRRIKSRDRQVIERILIGIT